MRVTTSYGYHGKSDCARLVECRPFYCQTHRVLWSECETIKAGLEGDSEVPSGVRIVYETGDCPCCEREMRAREAIRMAQAWIERNRRTCDKCHVLFASPDDVAIHLVDRHGVEYEEARIWLRKQVEEAAFNDKP